MWNRQPGFVHDDIAEQNQIEIQRPCGTRIWTLAPSLALDRQEPLERRPRAERRPGSRGGVEKGRLDAADVNRVRFVGG